MSVPAEILPRCLQAIDLICKARTLTAACREAGITPSTLKKYAASSPELQVMFDDALQEGYDTMAELLLEIDRDPLYGNNDPKMAKVISDNIKWFLARRRPKEYGDRMDVNVTVTADKEIIAALRASQSRVSAIEHQRIIDVTPNAPVNIDDLR